MSFLNGRISGITRLQINGDDVSFPLFDFDEQIKKLAFRNLFLENQNQSIGFVSINDCLDSDLTPEKTLLGDYRVFSLRVDQRVIPPSSLKIRILEETKKMLAETGQKRLFREQRENIKEAAEVELLKKVPPLTNIHDVAINITSGIVYLSSTTGTVIDVFADAFKEAFGIALWPYEVVGKEEIEKVTGGTTASIGRDFLTWLWFKSQQDEGVISIGDCDYTVSFNNRIVFEFEGGELTQTVSCSGKYLESFAEAKEAFRQGKKIKDARIKIENGDGAVWEFAYKGDSSTFRSVKLPMTEYAEEETPEGRNLDRLCLMATLIETVDELFLMYLELRNSQGWTAELSQMKTWVQKGEIQ